MYYKERRDKSISLRISSSDHGILQKVCSARDEDISVFIRRAIRKELAALSYYPENVKKALGLVSLDIETRSVYEGGANARVEQEEI